MTGAELRELKPGDVFYTMNGWTDIIKVAYLCDTGSGVTRFHARILEGDSAGHAISFDFDRSALNSEDLRKEQADYQWQQTAHSLRDAMRHLEAFCLLEGIEPANLPLFEQVRAMADPQSMREKMNMAQPQGPLAEAKQQ